MRRTPALPPLACGVASITIIIITHSATVDAAIRDIILGPAIVNLRRESEHTNLTIKARDRWSLFQVVGPSAQAPPKPIR